MLVVNPLRMHSEGYSSLSVGVCVCLYSAVHQVGLKQFSDDTFLWHAIHNAHKALKYSFHSREIGDKVILPMSIFCTPIFSSTIIL